MSGVYSVLEVTTSSTAPEVTTEEISGYLAEHTDLDTFWLSPGRSDRKPGEAVTFVGARQKYAACGLQDPAQALSEDRPDAIVTCHQEWNEDEVGGESTSYQAGRPNARQELSWHSAPVDGS
ncbi:hypothetical protein [Rathayibacter rathayi]|uniref:hypothetical protein n=1 Tax=Rathayibacter rathayi TaxID=33887 RepID=UPI000CE74ACD|nr:hypothetical protein [Rathayibacter rathayi]PPG94294.1 hypothetical protein C5C22_08920 [Rathayibacter rathayi]